MKNHVEKISEQWQADNAATLSGMLEEAPYFGIAHMAALNQNRQDANLILRAALHAPHPAQLQAWFIETDAPEQTQQLFQNPMPLELYVQPKEKIETRETSAITEDAAIEKESEVLPVENKASAVEIPNLSVQNAPQQITEPLTFEPYHTVDYFASQGIKLSQQEATDDQLGKQLKSFTQWLKTLKRAPENITATALDMNAEKQVVHLANDSLEMQDVVTEAMAEVWVKQGNKPKAAELYRKLSLRDASKSAYFAAKIEALK